LLLIIIGQSCWEKVWSWWCSQCKEKRNGNEISEELLNSYL